MRTVDGLDLAGQKATNAATPTAGTDVATKAYTDTKASARVGYQGAWAAAAAYSANDLVTYNGNVFLCLNPIAAGAATSFIASGSYSNATGVAQNVALPAGAAAADTMILAFQVYTGTLTRITPITGASLIGPSLNYGNNGAFGWVYSYTVTTTDVSNGYMSFVSQSPNTAWAGTYHLFRNLTGANATAGSSGIAGGTPTVTPTSYPAWIFTTAFANTASSSSVATQANQTALTAGFLNAKITSAAGYEALASGTSISRVYTLSNSVGTGANLSVALTLSSGSNTAPDLDTTNWLPLATSTPAGSMQAYGGGNAPAGWLICDGSSLLRASYPALFTTIGTTYGSVDSTHFTLPDLRSRVPIGLSPAAPFAVLGNSGGATTHQHTLSDAAIAEIFMAASSPAFSMRRLTTGFSWSANLANSTATIGAANSATITGGAPLTGHTDTADHTPPFQVVNFIIKT